MEVVLGLVLVRVPIRVLIREVRRKQAGSSEVCVPDRSEFAAEGIRRWVRKKTVLGRRLSVWYV
jgi:hypothetical protein